MNSIGGLALPILLLMTSMPSLLFIPLVALLMISALSAITPKYKAILERKPTGKDGVPALVILSDGSTRSGSTHGTLCSAKFEQGDDSAALDDNKIRMTTIFVNKINGDGDKRRKGTIHEERAFPVHTSFPLSEFDNYDKKSRSRLFYNEDENDFLMDDNISDGNSSSTSDTTFYDTDVNDDDDDLSADDISRAHKTRIVVPIKSQCDKKFEISLPHNRNLDNIDYNCETRKKKTKNTNKKAVSFDGNGPTYYADRFTKQDRYFLSYRKKDYSHFERDIELNMHKILKSGGRHPWNVETNRLCMRGLEKQIAERGSLLLCFPALKKLHVKRKTRTASAHERILNVLKEMQGQNTIEGNVKKQKRCKRTMLSDSISSLSSKVKGYRRRNSLMMMSNDAREQMRLLSMEISKDDRVLALKRAMQDRADAMTKKSSFPQQISTNSVAA